MSGGFTMVPNAVLRGTVGPDDKLLARSARLLYMLILDYAHGGDRPCTASQGSLAALLDLSPRQVRNLLNELGRAGLIREHRRGRGATNIIEPLLLVDRKRSSAHPPKSVAGKEERQQTNNANDNNGITDANKADEQRGAGA